MSHQIDAPRDQLNHVAITGLACRAPGAASVSELWDTLIQGSCHIGPVPASRSELYAAVHRQPDPAGAQWGGFLDDLYAFDPSAFGISPAEATHMDVQQRMVLEVAWHALESAGIPVDSIPGSRTGVFIGQGTHDQAMQYLAQTEPPGPFSNTGFSHAVTANRLSYLWDLRGPSLTVDTACSSSLTAVHLAAQSLANGECDLALVGGVNALISPGPQLGAAALTALSPTGTCRPFDEAANGYVRAEAAAVIVLRRLPDALAMGERVRAVIRGTAIGQDGRTNGLTAPSGRAQTDVIVRALDRAGVAAEDVDYVEAHGTGTPLGDPIEMRALAAALRSRPGPVVVGSIKAAIGHAEAAAGILGLIKAILVVENGVIPVQPGFARPNPRIDTAGLNVRIAETTHRLDSTPGPVVAGVSSFGFGGSNAHAIITAAPAVPAASTVSRATSIKPLLLTISADRPDAIRELADAYRRIISHSPDKDVPALLASAARHRAHHRHRVAICARTISELSDRLAALIDAALPQPVPTAPGGLGFIFSGHGSQWAGMGAGLLGRDTDFDQTIRACDKAFFPLLGWSISEVLAACGGDLDDIAVAQPLIFAVQVALAAALRARGVRPDAVAGHSLGEISAAVVAGKLALAEGCRIVHERNLAVVQARGTGGMAVLEMGRSDVQRLLDELGPSVELAAENSPRSCVVAGPLADLAVVTQGADELGAAARQVRVDYPSHTSAMRGPAGELASRLGSVTARAAECRFYSTVTGADATAAALDGQHWRSNLTAMVRFADAVRAMRQDGTTHFVEISPHPILLSAVRECLGEADTATLPTLVRDEEVESVLPILAGLYQTGWTPDFQALFPGTIRPADLPLYPFDHSTTYRLSTDDGRMPPPIALRTGHRIDGRDVLSAPATALLALTTLTGTGLESATGCVEALTFLEPIDTSLPVQVSPGSSGRPDRELTITQRQAAGWQVVATVGAVSPLGGNGDHRAGLGRDRPPSGRRRDVFDGDERDRVMQLVGSAADAGVDVRRAAEWIRAVTVTGRHVRGRVARPARAAASGAEGWLALEAGILMAAYAAAPAQPLIATEIGSATFNLPSTQWSELVLVVDAELASADDSEVTASLIFSSPDGGIVAELREVTLRPISRRPADQPAASGDLPLTSEAAPAAEGGLDEAAIYHLLLTTLSDVSPSSTSTPGFESIPFAELGIDSLLAVEIRNRLERALHIPLSVALLWRHPTCRELTRALAERLTDAGAPLTSPTADDTDDLLKTLDAELSR